MKSDHNCNVHMNDRSKEDTANEEQMKWQVELTIILTI